MDGSRGASSPSTAARIISFSSRRASCQFVVARVEPCGHKGRRSWTPFTEKYVQYRRPRFQRAMVFSDQDDAAQRVSNAWTAMLSTVTGQACLWRPNRSRSHVGALGLCLRLDESLPFVFVHVLRPVPDRATHLHESRAEALESP